MIKYIINLYKGKSIENILSKEIKNIHKLIPQDFGGGCSHEKALLMSFVISKFRLKNTADIGVYRGRSFFPQAIAHQLYSKGMVYGIDPFSNLAAIQNDRIDIKKELDDFLVVTDFQMLYDNVSKIIEDKNFQKSCQLVRKKSSEAALEFKKQNIKFGLVHIDGNHDTKFVIEDVNNYYPLLSEKSFIVLDDISWESVKPAYTILNKEMILIDDFINDENDFALFGKGLSDKELINIKEFFKKLKNKNL